MDGRKATSIGAIVTELAADCFTSNWVASLLVVLRSDRERREIPNPNPEPILQFHEAPAGKSA